MYSTVAIVNNTILYTWYLPKCDILCVLTIHTHTHTHTHTGDYEVISILLSLIVAIILLCVYILKYHIVHFMFTVFYFSITA